ncbi:MAG: hypothetical protein KF819_35005 [Labilithrix sp.]|nr:hypothetical protein [Labilithrix sp.]
MKSLLLTAPLAAALAAVAVLTLLAPACSSYNATGPAPCEDAKCAPGNKCLPYGGETRCRKTCTSNTEPATSCPFGFTCLADGGATFCVKDTPSTVPATCTKAPDGDQRTLCGPNEKMTAYLCTPEDPPYGCLQGKSGSFCCPEEITKAPKGQWGAACPAPGGFEDNPECDTAQGFFCYGTEPTDGASYCTRFNCASDRNCAAGFTCQAVNVAPNVTTAQRTIREVHNVCVKRDYCASCTSDVDCPPLNGLPQRCTTDDDGKGFCAPTCQKSENCPFDAKCVDVGIGENTCYPRAGRCVGDGSLCSPCRSDADCGDDGACVQGQYTTEKSCAKKSAIPCKAGASPGTDFECPAAAGAPKPIVRCLGTVFDQVPLNYCHGLYAFGESADVGCWTPAR